MPAATGYVQVGTTAPDRATADRIASAAVAERLAACAHVDGPLQSTYRWQGAVETASEWSCRLKTTVERLPALMARIRELHPYDVPEIVAQDIDRPATPRISAGSRSPSPLKGASVTALPTPPSPELLYLLAGDEEDLLAAVENLRPADVAEALNQLPVPRAARVVAALPFELAVQLLDEPELDRRGDIFELLDESGPSR